jgi:hypothetical protein
MLMKLKNIGVLAMAAAALFFVGLSARNCAYGVSRELEDIRTIVPDPATPDRSKDSIIGQDALELLRNSITILQDQNMTESQYAFQLENNGLSDHFKITYRFVPEPSTLLLLAFGGASLLRRGR